MVDETKFGFDDSAVFVNQVGNIPRLICEVDFVTSAAGFQSLTKNYFSLFIEFFQISQN